MAQFASSLVVAHALREVERLFGAETGMDWVGENSFQKLMLRHKAHALYLADQLRDEVICTKAAHAVRPVNQHLVDHGFGDVQLQDHGTGSQYAYAASVMRLADRWCEPGVGGYWLKDLNKPAFRVGARVTDFGGRQLAKVLANKDFSVWFVSSMDSSGFSMIDEWGLLMRALKDAKMRDAGAVLPLISVPNTKVDISALAGMSTGSARIMESLAAARYGQTASGFKFEMAAAVSASRGGCMRSEPKPDDFVVRGPEYFAIFLNSLQTMPLAVGKVESVEFSDNPRME